MLHLPGGGVVAPEFYELADRIQNGDGVWGGDPDLELRMGVVVHKATGKQARRLEVWRVLSDGSEARIGHWRMDEAFRIPLDLAQMRGAVTGRIEDAATRIDKHNAEIEAAASRKRQDAMAEKLSKDAYALVRSQGHARTSFSVPGRKEN